MRRRLLIGSIALLICGAGSDAYCDKVRLDPADLLLSYRIGTNAAGLIEGLHSSNLLVRMSAAQVIGERKVEEASHALTNTLRDDGAIVRFAAAEALLKLGSTEGVPVLVQLISGSDREVAVFAASALCKTGDPRGCAGLAKSLDNPEWLVRKAATVALAGATNAPNRRELLTKAAEDVNEKVRLAALEALSNDPDMATIQLLIGHLRDTDQVVRYGANKWLRELTGQSFRFQSAFPENAREDAVRRWEAWWNSNREGFVIKKKPKERQ